MYWASWVKGERFVCEWCRRGRVFWNEACSWGFGAAHLSSPECVVADFVYQDPIWYGSKRPSKDLLWRKVGSGGFGTGNIRWRYGAWSWRRPVQAVVAYKRYFVHRRIRLGQAKICYWPFSQHQRCFLFISLYKTWKASKLWMGFILPGTIRLLFDNRCALVCFDV